MITLYEKDDFCQCYISDQNQLFFGINACGQDLQYKLSGHSYEPILYAECNISRYSFDIHGGGVWFPSTDDLASGKYTWSDFCRDIGIEIYRLNKKSTLMKDQLAAKDIQQIINLTLIKNGETKITDFVFGEFVGCPNKRGTFSLKNAWFLYEINEKSLQSISGPFYGFDIIYACAKLLHKSKYFEEYRFSEEAKAIYIHSHYRSVEEAENAI